MKRNLVLISILIIISLIVNSCTPDTTSPNSSDARDKIVNTWNCSETSAAFGSQSFQVDISKDPNNSNRVILDNFFGLGVGKEVYATMNGLQLTIPTQTVVISQNDTWIISGTGNVASNYKTITFSYNVNDGNGAKPVSDTFTLP